MLLLLNSGPWFADWNYRVLALLFRLLPPSGFRISIAEFIIANSLTSTWGFAVAYYLLWRTGDEKTVERRRRLMEITIACFLAVAVTLVMRSWAAWPSPTRVAEFQPLYPYYEWNVGNPNCFPSHSTLICLIVAIGILPLSRKLGAALIVFTLFAISLPRLYVGGHYPIDVVASAVLSVISYVLVWAVGTQPGVRKRLDWFTSRGLWTECSLLLWTFELGEGFRSSTLLLRAGMHLARHIVTGNL